MHSTSSGRIRLDLHMHSNRSDGRYEPAEVLERCARGGLDVVALTDHDLCTVLDPGEHRIGSHRLRLIAGAEISGVHDGRELHLLVYFPHAVPTRFHDLCTERASARATRYERAIHNIGLDVPGPDAAARRGERSLTRHHLARALVAAGHARDLGDAFSRHAHHRNVPTIDLPFVEAIRIARRVGGVTSWAHPQPADVKQWLPEFVAAGLQGLEGRRPAASSKDLKLYRKAAKRHGLFLTGGSDFHGWSDPELGLFRVASDEIPGFLDALSRAA